MLFDFNDIMQNHIMRSVQDNIAMAYADFLKSDAFPCVAGKAAADRDQVRTLVVNHMACPDNDKAILSFLYDFVDECRQFERSFHSAIIIFEQPLVISESEFDKLMWERLQALSDRDALDYPFDKRVNPDVNSPDFSFSLKSEAFFIIGLHPASSRPARRFSYPALVFNPHAAFTRLREYGQYDKMKKIVRKNDLMISGSINPMLDDFGKSSEVFQYSGKTYSSSWQCPLHINHGTANNTGT